MIEQNKIEYEGLATRKRNEEMNITGNLNELKRKLDICNETILKREELNRKAPHRDF